MAADLSVSKQTVHKWLIRYKRFGLEGLARQKRKGNRLSHNRTSEALEQCVIGLAGRYSLDGVETLSDRLQYEYNITLHPTTIYRILKRNNVRYTDYYISTKKS